MILRKIKVAFILAFLAFGITTLLFTEHIAVVRSFPTGPPAGVTGAPGEGTCTGCHTPNPGAGEFKIVAPPIYVPGQTYEITVRHLTPDESRMRWGFELTSLSLEGAAGTFTNLSSRTQILDKFDRLYIEHTLSGTFNGQIGGAEWIFQWTAPAANVGPVTFYAAGNQANGDNTSEGDQIYTATADTMAAAGASPTPTPAASPTATPPPAPSPTPTPTPVASPSPVATPSPTPISTPTPTPTPTGATVSGRVFTPDGRGIRNAVVSITDSLGVRRTATTSSFGSYTFQNVGFGQNNVFGVTSKRYRFTTIVIPITADIFDLDFTGLE